MQTTEIVQRGIDYIEQHLNEPLSLEQIAQAASMSVPNLYRMFYAMTGHSIKEYIRKRRTSEACQFRLFGWNVDFEESPHPFGYQMVAVNERGHFAEHPPFKSIDLPGGLYAVTRTPAGKSSAIVAAWNRLFSEWLPRSTFVLGEHGFLEEYQRFNGHISRLKLYLPVKRGQDTETIEIVERPPIEVTAFRGVGSDCVSQADEALEQFLNRYGLVGDNRLQVFMSCSFPPNEMNSYELYLRTPDGFVHSSEDAHRTDRLEGGLYACLQTVSYGLMIGVLERIYLWLGTSAEYEPDGTRSWYVQYERITELGDTARVQQPVRCYVPVILRN